MKVSGEIIILIIIILGAFLLGGATYQGNDYVLPSSTSTTPGGSSSTPTETPTPTPKPEWSLSHTFLGCGNIHIPGAEILAHGNANGYMKIEIDNGSGGYDYYVGSEFTPPGRKYTVALLISEGFSTKQWRVRLFSGGSLQNGEWQGGNEKVLPDNGNPTGCQ